MGEIGKLVLQNSKFQQVWFVAGTIFAAFSTFWRTLVFLLESPPFHFGTQTAGFFG